MENAGMDEEPDKPPLEKDTWISSRGWEGTKVNPPLSRAAFLVALIIGIGAILRRILIASGFYR